MRSWGPECIGSRQIPEPRKLGYRQTGCSRSAGTHCVATRWRDGCGARESMMCMPCTTCTPRPKKHPATRLWRRRTGARGSCRVKTCQTLPSGGWIGCMPPSQICDFYFVSPSSFPSKRPCKPGWWLTWEPPQQAPKTYSGRLAEMNPRHALLERQCSG